MNHHNLEQSDSRQITSVACLENPLALHNSILSQLNLSPEGMTFAQIYDRMKADRREFGLEFIRKVTVTVFQLHGENLISCDDIFAEPGNGSVREREVLYKIAHRGKIHLLGLVLLSRIAVSNREQCDCGKSVTRVCPCGKEVCSAHWYDADGNHTLSEKDGMCSECVSAVQLQTWGESRNGIAGQL